MSNYIVLVKQVPDVSQITDNAFNPDTGTLIRSRLENVINELDAQALSLASAMKQASGDSSSRIVCLTMGPPAAAEVLQYGMYREVDGGVLLTDRKLGGADTWATANPLACAIRKIIADVFDANDDCYVICGMQSVDGDTAQVPAQIAEDLGVPCIPYVTNFSISEGKVSFETIVSGGSQVVSAKRLPAVLTVAKYEQPLFPSFAGARKSAAVSPITWGADDVGATVCGGDGSKTFVSRIFPPQKTSRKCQKLSSVKELAEVISSLGKEEESAEENGEQKARAYLLPKNREEEFDFGYEVLEKERDYYEKVREQLRELGISSPADITDEVKDEVKKRLKGKLRENLVDTVFSTIGKNEPSYSGDVWVVAEDSNGELLPAVFELLGKARQLADGLQVKVGVVATGAKVQQYSDDLISGGADIVYVIEHPQLEAFDPLSYRAVITDVVQKHQPQIILYIATPRGRVLAPMIASRSKSGLTADCTSLDVGDYTRKGYTGILSQTRPALGGNIMATICTKNSDIQMATVRPGVLKRPPADSTRTGEVVICEVSLNDEDFGMDIISSERGSQDVNFEAEIIVSGGKGLLSAQSYEEHIEALRGCLEKTLELSVEKGASRAAVEQGFVDRSYQVGQTGTSVGPKLYLALGISGAIQHMIGVANSNTIVAVNSDPHAPIFGACDYYLVANVEDVVPQLLNEFQSNQ